MDPGVFYAIGNSFPVGQTLDVGMSLPQVTLDTRDLFPKLVSGHEECLSPLLILLDVRDVFPLKGSSLLLKLYDDVGARSSVHDSMSVFTAVGCLSKRVCQPLYYINYSNYIQYFSID